MVGSPLTDSMRPIRSPPVGPLHSAPGGIQMSRPNRLFLAVAALSLIAAPVAAQDLTATLRIHGNVMVGTGAGFQAALDGQPVLPGQRIMIGEGGSATVKFSKDCERTYRSAGVFTVTPALCQEDQEESQQDQQKESSAEQNAAPQTEMGNTAGSSPSMIVSVMGAVSVIGVAVVMADNDDPDPDPEPASR